MKKDEKNLLWFILLFIFILTIIYYLKKYKKDNSFIGNETQDKTISKKPKCYSSTWIDTFARNGAPEIYPRCSQVPEFPDLSKYDVL